MKIAHLFLIAVVGISIAMSGCLENEPPATSEQIVEQMAAHRDDVRGFTCTMVMTGNGETSVADYTYKYPNMIRMEYAEPTEVAGQITVSNGTYIWMYDPAEDSVKTTSIPEYAQSNESRNAQFIDDLLETCTIEPKGSETVSGRKCHKIVATPKDAIAPLSITIWLDMSNWLPIKIETYQNDELVMSMEYRNIRFMQSDADIPGSTFEFEIPEGATVESMDTPVTTATPETMTVEEAQENVTFEIREPTNLPQGYEIADVIVASETMSTGGVVIIYTNATENNTMSAQITAVQLAERVYNESADIPTTPEGENKTITISGQDCTMTTMVTPFGDTIVMQWHDSEREYTLAGSLDAEMMVRIAESI
ncbi:MAG: outer membrane lipoprotein-sorting protein [Methanosarcinales archaeon]|nr:outer membrane lipoprotein-sorting protein [Methanosarcinales archaeon]